MLTQIVLHYQRTLISCMKRIGIAFLGNVEILLFVIVLYHKGIKFNNMIMMQNNYIFPIASLGAIFILLGMSMIFKRRTRIIVLMSINGIVSIMMIADVVYFRYYNDVISIPVLLQASLINSAMKSSIMNLFQISDLMFLSDILLFALIAVFAAKSANLFSAIRLKWRALCSVTLLAAGIGFVSYAFINLNMMTGNQSLSTVYDHSFFISNIGAVNYHGFDAFYFLSNKFFGGNKVSDDSKAEVKAYFEKKSENKNNFTGIAKDKNLIVIQVESMQNLVINFKVDGREVTPNLNKFIKKSIYFDNYYTQSAQGNTSDAEFITNNSMYAIPEGAVYFRNAGNTFASLPAALKKIGYKTMAMHAYRASFWNRATIYPALGFDKFYSSKDYNNDDILGGWGLSDQSFLNQSLEVLKQAKEPFYSFIITLTSHYPFEAFNEDQKHGRDFDAGVYNNSFFGAYLKAMNYVDKCLGEFLEGMDRSGLMDNSVIAIYGDHEAIKKGDLEAIKEHLGLCGNNDISFMKMRNVPLIIHLPGDEPAGLKTVTGGEVDFYPTIANLMGIDTKYHLGDDLLNPKKDGVIFRDGSYIQRNKVYLYRYGEAFDINTGEKDSFDDLKPVMEEEMHKMQMSDEILSNNLLEQFMAN